MRLAICTVAVLLVWFSMGLAADYVRLDHNFGIDNQTEDLRFVVLRECPTPEMIMGTNNGFVMTGIGDATWTFDSFTADPITLEWFGMGLYFTHVIDGVSPDTFMITGASMPPWGFPVITEEQLYFTLSLTWGDIPDGGSGEVCIDSAWVLASIRWGWSGLTCGGGPYHDRPYFLCGSAAEDVHPCCLQIANGPCTLPDINVKPPEDKLAGSWCDVMSFHFEADPGTDDEYPALIDEWAVVSGIGAIDGDGNYSVGPQAIGTYPVTIQVTNSCGLYDTYSFDVEFTNSDPEFTNCPFNFAPLEMFVIPSGYSFSFPLHLVDQDDCEHLTLQISDIDFYGDLPFLGDITLDSNVVIVNTTDADSNIQIRLEVTLEDGQGVSSICELGYDIGGFNCGDVNHLIPVDIDDVVFLAKYVFLFGWPPEPYHIGDVNCDYSVDIDDIVYLVAYIFAAGPAPCAECP